jgi:hypothetical protein
MSVKAPIPPETLALLDGLNSEQIRERLDALEREATALRVLFRVAVARERIARRQEEARVP